MKDLSNLSPEDLLALAIDQLRLYQAQTRYEEIGADTVTLDALRTLYNETGTIVQRWNELNGRGCEVCHNDSADDICADCKETQAEKITQNQND